MLTRSRLRRRARRQTPARTRPLSRHRSRRQAPAGARPSRESSRGPAVLRCEAVAHAPGYGSAFPLGSYTAPSPRLALRWLRRRAGELADQLDPVRALPVRAWLADSAEHERALDVLAGAHPYILTAHDDTAHYLLTVVACAPS